MENLKYQAHVAEDGWQGVVENGNIAGTVGQHKALEAFRIVDMNIPGLGVQAFAYVQDIGWSNGNIQGEDVGSTGINKHIEAVKIGLFGEKAGEYTIWYRLHVEDYGFMPWVRNGEISGTIGGNKQAEAIQIVLVKNTENFWPASDTTMAFMDLTPQPEPEAPKSAGNALDALNQARSYVGYVSGTSEYSIFGEGNWCCHFVRTCCHNAGVDFPNTAWVPDVEDWAKECGRWAAYPQPGYAVLFDFNDNGCPDHIGFVETAYGQFDIDSIEGNTGDPVGVYRKERSFGIYGYVKLGD